MFHKFYHGQTRKLISAFGSLFTNIEIDRYNTDGTVGSSIKVPVRWAQGDFFLRQHLEGPDYDPDSSKYVPQFPYLSYDITNWTYAGSRKRPHASYLYFNDPNDAQAFKGVWAEVPYDIGFQVQAHTKTHLDALKIMEQILPYFDPTLNIQMRNMVFDGDEMQVPITIQNHTLIDENPEGQRRVVLSIDFNVRYCYFGPIRDKDQVLKVAFDYYLSEEHLEEGLLAFRTIVEPGEPEQVLYPEDLND